MSDNIKAFLEADALLPCPFCGGEAFVVSSIKITQPSRYAVRCRDCLVETPTCEDSAHIKQGWNNRAPDLAKMVEDMRVAKEALEMMQGYMLPLGSAKLRDEALTRLKPYEKLFEKEGESDEIVRP